MRRFLKTNWGDSICFLLCVITGIIVYQIATGGSEEPLSFGTLIASVVFAFVAIVNLVRLKKKRALRDWMYPIYGLLFSLIMLFYTFAANPWYPMNSITGRTTAAKTVLVTICFLLVSSIVRLISRWVKKRKRKASCGL